MRFGFFVGFLIGAGLASLLGEKRVAEAPGSEGGDAAVVVIPAGEEIKAEAQSVIDKLKLQAQEAMAAAKQASEEKQAEMMRDFYESTHTAQK